MIEGSVARPESQPQRVAATIAGVEVGGVLALAAAGFVWSAALPIALLAALVFTGARYVAFGRDGVHLPAAGGAALLVVMAMASLVITPFPEITTPQVYRLLVGMALFYAIANSALSRGRLELLVTGIVGLGLLLAIAAPLAVDETARSYFFVPRTVADPVRRLAGDTINANVIGALLAVLLPPTTALALFAWRDLHRTQRVLVLAALPLMLVVLVLSQSRGAQLGVGAALAALVVLRRPRVWPPVIAAVALGSAGAVVAGGRALLEGLASGGSVQGLATRQEIWSRGLMIVQDFPFTGIGMGTFEPVVELLYPLFRSPPVEHAHNLLLQIAVDLGIPGLIGWLVVFTWVTVRMAGVYRLGRRSGDGWIAAIGAGLLAGQVAMMVHGIVDAALWGIVRPAMLVWVLWGIAVAAWRMYGEAGAGRRDGSA